MASTTGIELGPDTCVLAGVRTTRSGGAEIVALHTIEPAEWPAHDVALADMLRGVRRSKRFPKRACVVAWGLPEDAAKDTISRAAMRPLVDAGFRVDRVLTPPQALAILAGTRAKPGVQTNGVVWLALNMHGAAIAIVRGTELLFGRTFQWAYNPHLLDGKAQLLQRYSLISHLEPEVRRGIAMVRASHAIQVDAVVTCGDLPELRSLTMPLIEELDLEVETLDSMEGLRPVGKARFERLAEAAPAIRLACAAALSRVQRRRTGAAPPLARIAAAAAVVAALGYGTYAYFNRATNPAATARAVQTASRPAAKPPAKTSVRAAANPPVTVAKPSTAARAPAPAPQPLVQAAAKPEVKPPASTASTAAPKREVKSAPAPPVKADLVPPKLPAPSRAKAELAPPKLAAESPAKADPVPPKLAAQPPAKADSVPPKAAEPPAKTDSVPPQQQTHWTGDTRGVVFPKSSERANQPRQVPLKDPLPKIDSILIDQERRLAIIDGTVAGIGDQVGTRVIIQIDRDGVVLREPSGLLVRVTLRSRQTS